MATLNARKAPAVSELGGQLDETTGAGLAV